MLALTSAVSTVTVRDLCEQPSSILDSTSDVVAKPIHHRVFLFVVFTWGPSATLCTRSDSRSVQSSCSLTSSSLAELINLFKIGLLITAIRENNLHRLDLGTQELFRLLIQWRV